MTDLAGRLTEAQWRVLNNIASGRATYFGFKSGREARGGITGPVNILVRKGLLKYGRSIHDLTITEAGRAALAQEKRNG